MKTASRKFHRNNSKAKRRAAQRKEKDKLTGPQIVRPNPGLKGGELQLLAMQDKRQLLYAEKRRQHREAWWQHNDKWLTERGLTREDGSLMGDKE